jgi:hypothetical protein
MKLRLVFLAAIAASMSGVPLQADQRPNQSSQTPEPLAVAAEGPRRLAIPTWIEPTPRKFGIFTIASPELPGEIVKVSVPVGELTMRAARAIGRAQYRRAEEKARKEVEQALKDFQATATNSPTELSR